MSHPSMPVEPGALHSVVDAARRHLPVVHFAVDSLLWALAIPLGVWLRYDFRYAELGANLVFPIAVAIVLQGFFGFASGLYRRTWRYGSFDEVRVGVFDAISVGLILTVVLWWNTGIPRSVPLLATGLSLRGQIAARSVWRLSKERSVRPHGDHLQRLVVAGAGDGADQVLRTLRASVNSPYVPVALLDDDPAKRKLRLSGVRVDGKVDDLAAIAAKHHADTVLIAIPSAESKFVRRVSVLALEAKLKTLILPPVHQLLGAVDEGDIRPVNVADLRFEVGDRREHKLITHVITEPLLPADEMLTGEVPNIGRLTEIALTSSNRVHSVV